MRRIFQNFSVIASEAWQSNTECHSRLSGILQKDSGRAGVTKRALMVFSAIGLLISFGLLAGCVPALHSAAERGDINAVKDLLNKGADVNEKLSIVGVTPLMWAAGGGHVETVRFFIDKGADVNALGDASLGISPLYYAALKGHKEIVKLLIDKGADVDKAILALKKATNEYAAKDNQIAIEYLQEYKKNLKPVASTYVSSNLGSQKQYPSTLKSDIDELPIFVNEHKIIGDRDIAIVIGIEKYQDLPKSDFSKKDADIVKGYIKALGFAERNIELITDEKATKSSIEKSLEAWLPNRVKKDSRVFVYYSGHGAPDAQTGDAYLVPYDGDPNYLEVTGYPLKRLYDKLGKLQVAEVTVVLDSCFSGAGGRSVIAKGARPLVMTTTALSIPSNMQSFPQLKARR